MGEKLIIGGFIALRSVLAAGNREVANIVFDIQRKNKVYSSAYHYPEKKQYAFLLARAAENAIEVKYLNKEAFLRFTGGQSFGGIAAVVGQAKTPTADELLKIPGKGFYLAPEGVEDPYNLGQILRAGYALGVDGVFLRERFRTPGTAEVLLRSSAGASELLETAFYETPEALVGCLQSQGVEIICAAERKDAVKLEDITVKAPLCLVIGGEKRGISRFFLENARHTVVIGYRRPDAVSLSAVAASSIIVYEFANMLFT